MGTFIFGLFIFVTMSGFVMVFVELLGSILYDVRETKESKMVSNRPYSVANRYRPKLSVLIPAYNASKTIKECVESILAGSYKKVSITVIDDASKDYTTAIVKELVAHYPKQQIKLVTRRKRRGWQLAVRSELYKQSESELVLVLGADSTVTKDCLRNAVRSLAYPQYQSASLNLIVKQDKTITSIVKQYLQIISARDNKLLSVLGVSKKGLATGCMYKFDTLKRLFGRKSYRGFRQRYIANAIIETRAQKYYSTTKAVSKAVYFGNAFRITVLSAGILSTGYFIFIATSLNNSAFYGLAWVLVSLWLLIGIVQANQPVLTKLRLLSFLPVMYGLLYMTALIKLVGVVLGNAQNLVVRAR